MAEQADYFQMASSSPAEGLLERYPELFDSDGTLIRRLQARHSRIEEFRARGHRSNVIVKTITVSSSAEHAARVAGEEFAALTWLRKHLDSSLRDTVPEPLAWIPGTQTVAMRKLDGVTVGRLLRRHAVHGAFWSGGRLARIGEVTRDIEEIVGGENLRRGLYVIWPVPEPDPAQVEFLGELEQVGDDLPLLGDAVILDLNEVVLPAEDIDEAGEGGAGILKPVVQQVLRHE